MAPTTHPAGTAGAAVELKLRELAQRWRRAGGQHAPERCWLDTCADELDAAIDDLLAESILDGFAQPVEPTIAGAMDRGSRLILALSYAAGALSRQHAPGPGMIADDQRFARELLRLMPLVLELVGAVRALGAKAERAEREQGSSG